MYSLLIHWLHVLYSIQICSIILNYQPLHSDLFKCNRLPNFIFLIKSAYQQIWKSKSYSKMNYNYIFRLRSSQYDDSNRLFFSFQTPTFFLLRNFQLHYATESYATTKKSLFLSYTPRIYYINYYKIFTP